jgi:hypothetical protein
MNNDGSLVEKHTGDLVRVWLECTTSLHQAVEYGSWVWKSNVLQNNWLSRSGIGCICST